MTDNQLLPEIINGTVTCPECNVVIMERDGECYNCGWENPYANMTLAQKKANQYEQKLEHKIIETNNSDSNSSAINQGSTTVIKAEDTIKGLANFYNGFTKFLFFLFAAGCVIGIISFLVGSNIITAVSILSVSLLGIIAVGATAVLLDIMHNIRSMNQKQKASDN